MRLKRTGARARRDSGARNRCGDSARRAGHHRRRRSGRRGPRPGQLFLDNPKYTAAARATRAGGCNCRPVLRSPGGPDTSDRQSLPRVCARDRAFLSGAALPAGHPPHRRCRRFGAPSARKSISAPMPSSARGLNWDRAASCSRTRLSIRGVRAGARLFATCPRGRPRALCAGR